IPEWDGEPDTLATWLIKLNSLSDRSETVKTQLGQLVPTRLRKSAESWYFSLPSYYRTEIETNWYTLREAIGSYYMNRTWIDKQKYKALKASYREPNFSLEKPSEFYIRKTQLLALVLDLSASQIIMEVMNSAPSGWTSILTTHLYNDVIEFQAALKFHEDALMRV
ncbi:hypothetical protein SCHPADRAFT_791161, partial [Schizopora paradoxa]